jgi:hypothetical protein
MTFKKNYPKTPDPKLRLPSPLSSSFHPYTGTNTNIQTCGLSLVRPKAPKAPVVSPEYAVLGLLQQIEKVLPAVHHNCPESNASVAMREVSLPLRLKEK